LRDENHEFVATRSLRIDSDEEEEAQAELLRETHRVLKRESVEAGLEDLKLT